MGGLPTFVILVPCGPASMHRAVWATAEHVGPVYLRSSRVPMPHIYPQDNCPFQIGRANVVHEGADLTIIACDLMVTAALDAAVILSEEGGKYFIFYGIMDRAEEARALNGLPVGLAPGAQMVRPMAVGEILTWDDVKLDEESTLVKLRRQVDGGSLASGR